ncbi:cobalt ABC transporter permease [Lottiidibacillus patelloidae]|uniref:Cobalt ABC transporter permease n=1 Tax=Lottiidibacillus patelloidae TaxID=2670334 RepID=A0A263BQE1_9BACI|nr:energy-coupling factor transporter transmembrane protein EcfT [Lottiidibacillus patelloidae]OZM55933.1 cobalt ABC transporter permease [Lottiidibacillus patelloidae]
MNVIIGQYVPGKSVIHKLDARSKVIFTFVFVFIVFLANNFITNILLSLFILFTVFLTRINLSYIFRGILPIILISLITFIIHIFSTEEGKVIASFMHYNIHEQSLYNGIIVALRLLYIFTMASLLTLTSTPLEITDGIERLLKPLKRFNLPVHELALMMAISLRFIPTMIKETERIIKAQSARGASFTSGSMKDRFNALIPLFIPLFIGAFKRADDLAIAMEARGYNGSGGRTKYRTSLWTLADSAALIITALLAIVLAIFKTY